MVFSFISYLHPFSPTVHHSLSFALQGAEIQALLREYTYPLVTGSLVHLCLDRMLEYDSLPADVRDTLFKRLSLKDILRLSSINRSASHHCVSSLYDNPCKWQAKSRRWYKTLSRGSLSLFDAIGLSLLFLRVPPCPYKAVHGNPCTAYSQRVHFLTLNQDHSCRTWGNRGLAGTLGVQAACAHCPLRVQCSMQSSCRES
jgi:hypothetical protein